MGTALFALGLFMCLAGMLILLMEYRICRRVVDATSDQEDALIWRDVWKRGRESIQWKKLKEIADGDSNFTLQKDARRTLQLIVMYYALFVTGILLTGVGMYLR